MNKMSLLMLAGKLIGPLLDEIWNEESFEKLKNTFIQGLRDAADLTTFTEFDDVQIENVIEGLGNKEYQDDILDVLEDSVIGYPIEAIVHSVTAWFRELFNIPDNDE